MNTPSSGRLPASVYRRRRITVGVIALLVIALVVWGITAGMKALGGEGEPESQSQPPVAKESPSAEPSEEPEEDRRQGQCAANQIKVTASTDSGNYGPEQNPVLILTVENISDEECELNVGTGEQEFLITSGSDRIFSTVDCAANVEDIWIKFASGHKETARFNWSRVRSSPGCKAVDVQPRPGTYVFTAKLGEVESDPTRFNLT
ncbi:hypothetical protein [Glutamicibacter sp. PS]|uniref:hypothetical protein n=1 Tax=Glutamicibacter sp. PS TaxID=3075634 RepID=UPI00283E89C0|nr:hypothetical protein [Glutamicibacter sp. PS]MDR4534805.1 hypothetical protein [Glutamicibacter sp. PS]